MAGQDIHLRYRRSLLGPLWISAAMAIQVVGIGLLFSQVFDRPLDEFMLYVSAGFLTWSLVSALITEGCSALVESSNNLRALPIPTPILAAKTVNKNLIIFFHNFLIIGLLMLVIGFKPTSVTWVAFLGLAVIALIGYMWAVTIAPFCLRYRDVTQIISSIVGIMFFVTPIMWMPSQGRVSEFVVHLNPAYHLVEVVRAPLLGSLPTELNWGVSIGILALLTVTSFISLGLSRGRIYLWL